MKFWKWINCNVDKNKIKLYYILFSFSVNILNAK